MFNLKTLSDSQAELMQGGWSRGGSMDKCYRRPEKGSYGPESITITNIRLDVVQVADSLAFTIGGHQPLAMSEVDQELEIDIEVG